MNLLTESTVLLDYFSVCIMCSWSLL